MINNLKNIDIERLEEILERSLKLDKKERLGQLEDYGSENPFSIILKVYFHACNDLNNIQVKQNFINQILIPYYENSTTKYICSYGDEFSKYENNSDPAIYRKYFEKSGRFAIPFKANQEQVSFIVTLDIFLEKEPKSIFFKSSLMRLCNRKKTVFNIVNKDVYESILVEFKRVIDKENTDASFLNEKLSKEKISIEAELLNIFLDAAIDINAADVHIHPIIKENGSKWVDILLTIDGPKIPYFPDRFYDYKHHDSFIRELKKRCKIDTTNLLHEDGSFVYKKINWRVAFLATGSDYDLSVTIRKLDKKGVLLPLNEIFKHVRLYNAILKIIDTYKAGFILVTGGIGSGKTTSIYSLLWYVFNLYNKHLKIVTVEDPIEYEFEWLHQSQVKTKNLEPLDILKQFLRFAPDWILAGEIRDQMMLEPAIHAARSGHFTVATFHTNTIMDTFKRMKDYGVSPLDIEQSVVFVMNQILLRTLCPKCKIQIDEEKFKKGPGCNHCFNEGERGRIAVSEFIFKDPEDEKLSKAIVDFDSAMLDSIIESKFLTKRTYVEWAKKKGFLAYNDQQLKL
jgi:type II secretory ATPase GspE/PulE/Tfp pilus assembly ATPase PilB-like protein